ncbi:MULTISPECIES: DUF1810 domain-containing protein [Methylococcus]|uniref:DUF1810 domain-containing protein n=1 Tax=Methylococcus capsulatus TaxID=414 RepID=A0ABZ2F4A3_METCP|nr:MULTISPECIES: DUF1810 domain-containing protein [Methylococcus]MDF9392533.1 DUF1810 domain-containing protein [Methylococcus capsulatus]
MASQPPDPFDLDRFLAAQAKDYANAIAELRAGRKRTHWMWYVFPQLRGLGLSPTAQFYGIGSAEEARAYLGHEVLRMRLRECVSMLNELETDSPEDVFGRVDAMKLQSSLTLFEAVAADKEPFALALEKFFGGERDERSLAILATMTSTK